MKTARSGKELRSLMGIAAKTTEQEFITIVKKLAFDGFTELVMITPVDTGFAKGNWRVGVNVTDEAPLHNDGTGVNLSVPQFGGTAIEFGDVVHLYNNTVYIGFLDAGRSVQAPVGMIYPTFEKLSAVADRLAKELSKRKLDV